MKKSFLFLMVVLLVVLSGSVSANVVWRNSFSCANAVALGNCGDFTASGVWQILDATLWQTGTPNQRVSQSLAKDTGGFGFFQINASDQSQLLYVMDSIADSSKVLEVGFSSSTQFMVNDGASNANCGSTFTPGIGDWFGVNKTTSPYQVWRVNRTATINLCNYTTTRSYAFPAGESNFESCYTGASCGVDKAIKRVCSSTGLLDCMDYPTSNTQNSTEVHNIALSGSSLTEKRGLAYTPDYNVSVLNVTQIATGTATHFYLALASSPTTYIYNLSFTGQSAVIPFKALNLTEGTKYLFLLDKDGASYTASNEGGSSINNDATIFGAYTGCFYSGSVQAIPCVAVNILSITVSNDRVANTSSAPAPVYTNITNSTYNLSSGYTNADQIAWQTNQSAKALTYDSTPTVYVNVSQNDICAISIYNLNYSTMLTNRSYYNTTNGNSTLQIVTWGNNLTEGVNNLYISCAGSNSTLSTSGALVVNYTSIVYPTLTFNPLINVTDIQVNFSLINYTAQDYTNGNINYTLRESNVGYNQGYVLNLSNPYPFNVSVNLTLSRWNPVVYNYSCSGLQITNISRQRFNLSSLQQRVVNCTMDISISQSYTNWSLVVDNTDYNFNISSNGVVN